MHREEHIEQIAVPLDTLLRDDGGVLRNDETAFLQQTDMLGDRVAREVELLCDDRFTRVALVCFTVRVTQQVDVHGDCTGRQVKVKMILQADEHVVNTRLSKVQVEEALENLVHADIEIEDD